MHEYLKKHVDEGKSLDEVTEVPGHSFDSTIGENYHDARRYFMNNIHQLVVSPQVQKFAAQNIVNWKKLLKEVKVFEKEQKKQEAEPKHLAPKEPEPAPAVREKIL
jgi:hypothetical protein